MENTDIYHMNLHDEIKLDKYTFVKRVPGGWIYLFQEDSNIWNRVFVPLSDEFRLKVKLK